MPRAWALFKWVQAYKSDTAAPLLLLLSARLAQCARAADEDALNVMFGPPHDPSDKVRMQRHEWALQPAAVYKKM